MLLCFLLTRNLFTKLNKMYAPRKDLVYSQKVSCSTPCLCIVKKEKRRFIGWFFSESLSKNKNKTKKPSL